MQVKVSYGLKQSLRASFGQFASVVQAFGLSCFQKNHSVFWQHQGKRLAYVDIILIGDVSKGLQI